MSKEIEITARLVKDTPNFHKLEVMKEGEPNACGNIYIDVNEELPETITVRINK